jgi:hypothetical protein
VTFFFFPFCAIKSPAKSPDLGQGKYILKFRVHTDRILENQECGQKFGFTIQNDLVIIVVTVSDSVYY